MDPNKWPEIEDLDPQEWKLLFMLLCENRAKIKLDEGLTEYGKDLLKQVQRKIGILVVGVDIYEQG